MNYLVNEFEPQQFQLSAKSSGPVDPREGSQSEIQFLQSDLSCNMQKGDLPLKPILSKNTSSRQLRFNSNQQLLKKGSLIKKDQNQREVQQNEHPKSFVSQQTLLRFRDKLFEQAKIYRTNNVLQQQVHEQFFSFNSIDSLKKNNESTAPVQNSSSYIIQPSDVLSKLWDLLALIITAFALWLSPFISTFSLNNTKSFEILIYCLLFFMIFDCLIVFNKAIIIQGELIQERKQIILIYIKTYVYSDLIHFILWIVILIGINDQHIRQIISFFQTCFILQKLYVRLNNYIDCLYMSGSLSELIDLIILISTIFFCIHMSACYFAYVGFATENNWLEKNEISDSNIWIQYNMAMYWATMTMVTVGYGDVTAVNQYEKLYSIVIMFISSLIFAYSVNSIGIILKNISNLQHEYKKRLIQMNQFMNDNFVNQSVQNKIRNYLKYLSDIEQRVNSSELAKLISILPSMLQNELVLDIKKRIVKEMRILQNFSNNTLQQITNLLKLQQCIPNEIISNPLSLEDKYLYYIEKGEVEIYESKTSQRLQILKAGECFGEIEFFTNSENKYFAKSTKFSQIYSLSRKEFLIAVRENQVDLEKFHLYKDEIIFNKNYKVINQKCIFCQKFTHNYLECHWILYKPDLERLVKSEYFCKQKRSQFSRIQQSKVHTLGNKQDIVNSIQNYQILNFPQEITTQKSDFNINLPGSQIYPSLHDIQQSHVQLSNGTNTQNLKAIAGVLLKQKSTTSNNEQKGGQGSINNLEDQTKSAQFGMMMMTKNVNTNTTQLLEEEQLQFHYCHIDGVFYSKIYLPHNDRSVVILNMNKRRKKYDFVFNQHCLKYTFFRNAIELMRKRYQGRSKRSFQQSPQILSIQQD